VKNFDFYEFTAILVPGTVTLLAIVVTIDAVSGLLDSSALTVGQFGVFVVLAYVAGHLTQGLGNQLEKLWWAVRGGMPTDWPFSGKCADLLSPRFGQALLESLRGMGYDGLESLEALPREEWGTVHRLMHTRAMAAGRGDRIDTFNGIYGMHRGLATAFVIALVCESARPGEVRWVWIAFAAGALVLAVHRMDRFARNYARQLYLQAVPVGQPRTGSDD